MKYDPQKHHRRSIRLKGYDYSQAGAYFVTIVTQHRECVFGETANEEMRLNAAGQMAEKWWLELNHKFPNVDTDEYVVMPNHFHGIVIQGAHIGAPQPDATIDVAIDVGADLRVGPVTDENRGQRGEHVGLPLPPSDTEPGTHTQPGAHIGAPLPTIVQWFKTMTTNEYIRGVKTLGWPPFPGKLWQRNYYEHIIRNDEALARIRQYIANNPLKWVLDEENPMRAEGANTQVCPDEPHDHFHRVGCRASRSGVV